MALKLSKLEKIAFGDLEVAPQMSQEKRLRVSNLKVTEKNLDEAREILSECFGAYAEEVKSFMEKNLFVLDLTRIQVYLTQGQSGLDSFEKRMETIMEKEMEKKLEETAKQREVEND